MRFESLPVGDAWLIHPEPERDERGLFARIFDREEFLARGIVGEVVQSSVAWNAQAKTLRGLHLQRGKYAEGKLIRCTRGAAYDVLVDLRPGSQTFRKWAGVELDADNRQTVWAPPGVAHGYLTLCDETELEYRMTAPHAPAHASGVRWDDPALAIEWPAEPALISARDREWPLLGA